MQMSMHLYIHITRSSGWYKALCCVNINLFLFWQVCNGFGQVSAQQRNFGSLVDRKYVVLIVAHEWVELDRILYDCAFRGTQQSPYSLTVCQGGMPHKQLCSGRLFFQSWYFQPTPPPPRGSKVGGEIDQHQVTEGWPKDDRRANQFCGPRPNQRDFRPAVDKPSKGLRHCNISLGKHLCSHYWREPSHQLPRHLPTVSDMQHFFQEACVLALLGKIFQFISDFQRIWKQCIQNA